MPCGPENVEKLTIALMGLIKDAQEKGIDQKDLDKVKETWKKQYHVNLQNNGYWLSSLSNAWIDENNPENILDYEQKVDALTTAGVQAAAKKYLTLSNMTRFVLYPESYNIKQEVKTTKPF
jgi:zinc protease